MDTDPQQATRVRCYICEPVMEYLLPLIIRYVEEPVDLCSLAFTCKFLKAHILFKSLQLRRIRYGPHANDVKLRLIWRLLSAFPALATEVHHLDIEGERTYNGQRQQRLRLPHKLTCRVSLSVQEIMSRLRMQNASGQVSVPISLLQATSYMIYLTRFVCYDDHTSDLVKSLFETVSRTCFSLKEVGFSFVHPRSESLHWGTSNQAVDAGQEISVLPVGLLVYISP
ncbi:hypothetical protein M422DRAFT_246368 [Sphaerobolus stellatus SS14]|nr:hypothetical protein M422DRAFT_246368 [Sphaerobolus stellatus SS14]